MNFSLPVPKMSLLNMLGDSGGGEEIEETSRGTTDSRVNTLVVSLELTCYGIRRREVSGQSTCPSQRRHQQHLQ